MNDKVEILRKEILAQRFVVLSKNMSGETEEGHSICSEDMKSENFKHETEILFIQCDF
jgi:hypothetical protein